MLGSIQRLGGAMFTPVLLFPFVGIIVGLAIVLKNPIFMGELADKSSLFYQVMTVLEEGGWTIFRNMPLVFAIGLPIGLAKMAHARAVMVVLVSYLTYNYFIGAMAGFWGGYFGVDFTQVVGGTSGLTEIAGIKTLDSGIFGAILISALVTWIHNRYFEKQLPSYLGIFQGASYVAILSFFAVLVCAWMTLEIWPTFQSGVIGLQGYMIESGSLGVWLYTFLERILIPTGLHHFVWTPFIYSNAITPNGIAIDWLSNLPTFIQSSQAMIDLFPAGGFALHGNSKVFGCLGIALAMYHTADPDNKQKVASLLIPATLTAVFLGITEPLEFTFLFIAPWLFGIHALLAATMAMTMYSFGVVGNFGAGLIEFTTVNWIPLLGNHTSMIVTQIAIGLMFTVIYFFTFKTLIMRFNVKTPGRSEGEVKLHTKHDFNQKHGIITASATDGSVAIQEQAEKTIIGLGGVANIEQLTNCATRLRVTVKDASLVETLDYFVSTGAISVVTNGNAIQVIIGLSVPQLREACRAIIKEHEANLQNQNFDELQVTL